MEGQSFEVTGPLHLTSIDWNNEDHKRSVAACLVQGVYMMEHDRSNKRVGDRALAPPYWKWFGFELCNVLIDDSDSSIFGAIFLFGNHYPSSVYPPPSSRYVIAFRGTITKGDAVLRDLRLDIHCVKDKLHESSRFERAMQAVGSVVETYGRSSYIWLAGHSLGSALVMLVGKSMALTHNVHLESFLFNPPYIPKRTEIVKIVKHGIRVASSVKTAVSSVKNIQQRSESRDTFVALSQWMPSLYVNPSDLICSGYVGYFEDRKTLEDEGIERVASHRSIGKLVRSSKSKETVEEPWHLIPSANLLLHYSYDKNPLKAHCLSQWWRSDIVLDFKSYR